MAKMSKIIFLIPLLAIPSFGCSPNKLNEKKVYEALNPHVEKLPCVSIFISNVDGSHESFKTDPGEIYPIELRDVTSVDQETGERVYTGGFMIEDLRYRTLTKLVRNGLMDVSSEYVDESQSGGRSFYVNRFEPAPDYKSYFTSNEIRDGLFEPVFCFGKGVITEVVSFTLPDSGDNNSSIVKYKWKSNAPENLLMLSQSFNFYKTPKVEGSETAMLVLTNNGWELASAP